MSDWWSSAPVAPAETAPAAAPAGNWWDAAPVADPRLPMGKRLADPANPQSPLGAAVPNFVAGAYRGAVTEPIDAGAQMLARGFQSIAPGALQGFANDQRASTDESVAKNAADFKQNYGDSTAASIGKVAGNVGSGVLISSMLPASLPGAIAGGAIGGLAQPVAEPKEGGQFWTDKLKQAGVGAAVGGVAGAATKLVGKALTPANQAEVDALRSAGVEPTMGQTAGGMLNTMEQKLTSLPIVGDVIVNARQRAVDTFNRALANKVLAPIGQKLEGDTAVGREAVDEVARKVSAAYETLVPKLSATADGKFLMDMQSLRGLAQNLPAERAAQFEKILTDNLIGKFNNQTATITGESLKEAESALGRLASTYRGSAVGDERLLGDALRQAQGNLRDLVARSNPQLATELQAANSAWSMFTKYADAAQRAGSKEGVVTPPQMVAAVRAGDNSLGNRTFARGNSGMQDFAEAAQKVLGSKVPDSGTAGRGAMMAALLGGPGAMAGLGNPLAAAGILAGYGAAAAPYTAMGQRAAGALFGGRPAAGILAATPYAGGAAGRLYGNQ